MTNKNLFKKRISEEIFGMGEKKKEKMASFAQNYIKTLAEELKGYEDTNFGKFYDCWMIDYTMMFGFIPYVDTKRPYKIRVNYNVYEDQIEVIFDTNIHVGDYPLSESLAKLMYRIITKVNPGSKYRKISLL